MFKKVGKIKIEAADMQVQKGSTDCGVFAIAFATSIAINHKVDMKYDQARMRAHLVHCIEKRELSCFHQSNYNNVY